jgi:hypothetical protein
MAAHYSSLMICLFNDLIGGAKVANHILEMKKVNKILTFWPAFYHGTCQKVPFIEGLRRANIPWRPSY